MGLGWGSKLKSKGSEGFVYSPEIVPIPAPSLTVMLACTHRGGHTDNLDVGYSPSAIIPRLYAGGVSRGIIPAVSSQLVEDCNFQKCKSSTQSVPALYRYFASVLVNAHTLMTITCFCVVVDDSSVISEIGSGLLSQCADRIFCGTTSED